MALSFPTPAEWKAASDREHRALLGLLLAIKHELEKISADLRAAQVLPPAPGARGKTQRQTISHPVRLRRLRARAAL
jgi:hypothetical protein